MEKAKELTKIGDHYSYSKDGTLYYTETKPDKNGDVYEETTAIANHTPILLEQRIVDNGIETNEQLMFSALRDFHKGQAVAITLKDVLSQTPNIKFGAACRIYIGKGAKSRYSEAMQVQCENAPVLNVYQHTGYSLINGERVFINGKNSVTKNGLTDQYNVVLQGEIENYCFTTDKDTDRYAIMLSLLPKVAPLPLYYASMGLSFLTPLNAMLRELGIEPQFILYFTGKTGSQKTTMAKLLLNFFGKFDNGTAPTASFRDTANAIEKKFAVTDSSLVLLDDRIPSTTAKIKAQMEQVEQSVSRMIGDRSGRARMNADGTLKTTYRPKCNLIITAEESFSNVGESAIARSISVELRQGDIDLMALTEVQQKANRLNECMSEYIQYVISHWDEIKIKIKPLFVELRAKAQNGEHGRLAECVAHLQIGIDIMCDWLIAEGVIDNSKADKIKEAAWNVFVDLAEKQNRRIVEENPVKMFIDAIKEMKDRGVIRIDDADAPSPIHQYGSGESLVGYKDKDFYYLYPSEIYSRVRRFYLDQDKNFPLSRAAIFKQLRDEHLIQADKDQIPKQKRITGRDRQRFLWIVASALENEEENDHDD